MKHLGMVSGHFRTLNWNESIVFLGLSKFSIFELESCRIV